MKGVGQHYETPHFHPRHWHPPLWVEIDQYGFFGADTDIDISAIHGLIADNRYFQNFKILFSVSLSKM